MVPSVPKFLTSKIGKHGVLVLNGFGIRVQVDRGHLLCHDGIADERRTFRLPRVNHGLKRLVCISGDGFVTLAALNWLSSIEASFIMLDRRGKIQFVTAPTAPTDACLQRAQALALQNGVGMEISRTLIDAKLIGQERVMREQLKDGATADVIARLRLSDLPEADNFERIRTTESHAAVAYFSVLRDVPVMWPKADLRKIPEHWLKVGPRQSPLSGGPRLSVTPVHSIINYCAALLESESRLAISALGPIPSVGLGLHADTPNRDSLAFDVLEPCRPLMESWVLSWIAREPLHRSDFYEIPSGNVRLATALCRKLAETVSVWSKLIAPWSELVAERLWASTRKSESYGVPTRLTNMKRRVARGRPPLPSVNLLRLEHVCRGCGKKIRSDRSHCGKCAIEPATKRLVDAARTGRMTAHSPQARSRQGEKQRLHAKARLNWTATRQPAWVTPEVYSANVQPILASLPNSTIAKAIGVSRWYASRIRKGYRPHARHWKVLAQLAGLPSIPAIPKDASTH